MHYFLCSTSHRVRHPVRQRRLYSTRLGRRPIDPGIGKKRGILLQVAPGSLCHTWAQGGKYKKSTRKCLRHMTFFCCKRHILCHVGAHARSAHVRSHPKRCVQKKRRANDRLRPGLWERRKGIITTYKCVYVPRIVVRPRSLCHRSLLITTPFSASLPSLPPVFFLSPCLPRPQWSWQSPTGGP